MYDDDDDYSKPKFAFRALGGGTQVTMRQVSLRHDAVTAVPIPSSDRLHTHVISRRSPRADDVTEIQHGAAHGDTINTKKGWERMQTLAR